MRLLLEEAVLHLVMYLTQVLEASACFKLGKLLMNSAARKGEIGGNSIDDTFPFTIARQVHNPTGLLGHLESRKRSEGMNAYHLS